MKSARLMRDLVEQGACTCAEWLLLGGTSANIGRCATHMPLGTFPTYEVKARRKIDFSPQTTFMALSVISVFASSEVGCTDLGLLGAQLLSCETQLILEISGLFQEAALFFP